MGRSGRHERATNHVAGVKASESNVMSRNAALRCSGSKSYDEESA